MQQLIKEPTHILTESSLCIDLLFTSQPNLVIESGVNSSLRQICNHQIIYTQVILKVCYTPPYGRETWHDPLANFDQIQRAI